jgi:hypothetical protein
LKLETLDVNCLGGAEHGLAGIYQHAFEDIMRMENPGFIQAREKSGPCRTADERRFLKA